MKNLFKTLFLALLLGTTITSANFINADSSTAIYATTSPGGDPPPPPTGGGPVA